MGIIFVAVTFHGKNFTKLFAEKNGGLKGWKQWRPAYGNLSPAP
jgi:hypothetical protein